MRRYALSCSTFWWPVHPGKFLGQLRGVGRVNERKVHLGLRTLEEFQFLRRADDEPEHLGVGVVEHLTQLIRADQHAAVARDGQCLVAHAQAARAFQHEIKLLRADVFVQRVRALGRQPPEPRAEILAPRALQIIRVRDAHQVGRPPGKVFRLDEMVTLNGFHKLAGERFVAAKVKQLGQYLAS